MAFKLFNKVTRKPAQKPVQAQDTATMADVQKAVEEFKEVQEQATDSIANMAEDIMAQVVEDINNEDTADRFSDAADEETNKVKVGFFHVLDVLKRVSGASDIAKSLHRVIAAGETAAEGDSLKDMATECRHVIREEYMLAIDVGNRSKADILDFLMHEGNVFDMLFITADKICGLVAKGLHLLGVKMQKNDLLRGICKAMSHIAGIMLKGIKVAFKVVATSASYFLAVVIKAADWAVNTIKELVNKVRNGEEAVITE